MYKNGSGCWNLLNLRLNMKLVASFIATLAAVQISAIPTDTDLGAAVKNFLLKLQQSMPCGFEDGESWNPYIMKKNGEETIEYNAPDLQ